MVRSISIAGEFEAGHDHIMLFGVIYMPFLALQATPIPDWNVLQLRFPLRDLVDSPQHFLSAMLYDVALFAVTRKSPFPCCERLTAIFWSPFVTIGLLPFIGVMVPRSAPTLELAELAGGSTDCALDCSIFDKRRQ